MKATYSLIVLWTLVWQVQVSDAVREGTANAGVMIQGYEQEGNFAKAALWHEAAADCLKIISIPMTEIQTRYYVRRGKNVLADRSRGELGGIKKRQEYHLKAAKIHWERFRFDRNPRYAGSETEGISAELEVEREKITQFISAWAQIYPNRFYHYGIYPSFFKVKQEIFKKKEDYAAALNLEADAAEMCADQYNEITVAYFQGIALDRDAVGRNLGGEDCITQYEKIRDAHRRRAALLRETAEGKPKTFPIEAETALRDLPHQAISPAPKLTSAQALKIANSDTRLQEHLTPHTGVRGYASFQGFAWFVSYYNHGWGNIGIVLVDDKTGTVLDILIVNPKNR